MKQSLMNSNMTLKRRLAIYATEILMVLLCILMLRNFVSAIYYGVRTSSVEIQQYYDKGLSDATDIGKKGNIFEPRRDIGNPLLLRMYEKGFRDGIDSIRNERSKHEKG